MIVAVSEMNSGELFIGFAAVLHFSAQTRGLFRKIRMESLFFGKIGLM
jgi:hypothetical protein